MQKLTARQHALIDYLVVLFLLLAPKLFSLPLLTAIVTYAIAGVHLTLTVLTNFPGGLLKVVPLVWHGRVELMVSIALVGVALWLGSIEGTTSLAFYLAFAAAVFLTYVLTDYRSAPAKQRA